MECWEQIISRQTGNEKKKREWLIPEIFSFGALFILVVSFFLPPDKIIFQICSFKNITGLPCPGCGLTRSVINISHLNFFRAFRLNPMGYFIYLILIAFSFYSFIPESLRIKTDTYILKHLNTLIASVCLFFAFLISIWIFRLIAIYDMSLPVMERL